MSRFTVISSDSNLPPEEFIAGDSGQVLGLVHRLGWSAADVNKDGEYLFSISLNREGVWSIIQKQQPKIDPGPLLRPAS